MPISDKYDKLRDHNQRITPYAHYPKWVQPDKKDAPPILVNDEFEHEEQAPKDYSQDPYLADRRKEQAEAKGNLIEMRVRPLPKAKTPTPTPQKLDPKPASVITRTGSTLLTEDGQA